jgi:hypothetical protein
MAGASKGDARVLVRLNRSAALAALTLAAALGGCSNFDTSATWFSKPIDVFGSRAGYSYSSLDDKKQERPITANDLIDANGACPLAAAPVQPQPAPPPQPQAAGPGTSPSVSADMASLLGGGVAIGMSECEVVARLGQATAINAGKSPNGSRSVVLTYKSGPRPGVYRFDAGRLSEMDRVELPPPPPPEPAKKKTAKKKPTPANEPPKPDAKT